MGKNCSQMGAINTGWTDPQVGSVLPTAPLAACSPGKGTWEKSPFFPLPSCDIWNGKEWHNVLDILHSSRLCPFTATAETALSLQETRTESKYLHALWSTLNCL